VCYPDKPNPIGEAPQNLTQRQHRLKGSAVVRKDFVI
jgi:hypothetical protein